MAVDQENLQPVGEQPADNQPRLDRGQIAKQDTLHRNRRSLNLGLADLRTNPLTRRFLWTSARILTAGTVLGAAISDFIFHPTPDVNAGSATAVTALTPQPDNHSSIEAAGDPFSPYEFTLSTGEKGLITIHHGSGAIFPNTQVDTIDTTELSINGSLPKKTQAAEGLFLKLKPDTYQIITICERYHPKNKILYYVDGYRYTSEQDSLNIPLVIRMVPLDTIDDYSTQRLMQITLPSETLPNNGVQSFNLATDYSYLDLIMNNGTIYRVYLDSNGKETGRVEVKQASYNVYVPIVLDATTK